MKFSKRKIVLVLIALVMVAITLIVSTQTAYLAPLFVQGESETFRYSAQGTNDGGLYVTISPFYENAQAMEKYRQVNSQRGVALDKQKQKNVPVVITLNKPISQQDAQRLVEQADVKVDSFLLVGHSNPDNTKRGTYIQFGHLKPRSLPNKIWTVRTKRKNYA